MKVKGKPVVILLAEDDDDDFQLTRDALQESHVLNDLHRVVNGEELMDYLYRRNAFTDAKSSPVPGGWHTHDNSEKRFWVAYPLRICFLQRVGLLFASLSIDSLEHSNGCIRSTLGRHAPRHC